MTTHVPWLALAAVGVATGLATLAGGFAALRFRSKINLFLGFSSGAVIGVALFDLLPEALALGASRGGYLALTTATGAGFAAYFTLDRLLILASRGEARHRGHVGPGALTIHSFMDGLGIGLAFQVSTGVGLVVAIAVLAHDLFDGVNTVTLSLAGEGPAKRWLAADALAPLIGLAASRLVTVPSATLALLLALFAGFFLYIGASELLPQTHQGRPRATTILATLAGLALIWVAVGLAGG